MSVNFKHMAINAASLLSAFFAVLILLASSMNTKADTQLEQEISQNIESTMNKLIQMLQENEAKYSENADLFYRDLNSELSQVINFKRIALKVMGKHGRKASKDERAAFTEVFKQSLYRAYAGTLLEDTNVEATVVNAVVNPRNAKKAKVNLEVVSGSGQKFDVVYSLHKGKDDVYKVENIIVMGINIGLVFRDQFQEKYKQHRGDIAKIIEEWSAPSAA